MANSMKEWIMVEGRRNKQNAALYATLVCGSYGQSFEMFIGHHLAYKQKHEEITTLSEIPSADTLLFDHEIMIDVFDVRALDVMAQLARTPAVHREGLLAQMLHDHAKGNLLELLCQYTVEA